MRINVLFSKLACSIKFTVKMTDDVTRNGVFTGYERLFKKKANRRENLVFQLLLNLFY